MSADKDQAAACETCAEPTVGQRVIRALRLPQRDELRTFHADRCWEHRLGEWEQVKEREVRG